VLPDVPKVPLNTNRQTSFVLRCLWRSRWPDPRRRRPLPSSASAVFEVDRLELRGVAVHDVESPSTAAVDFCLELPLLPDAGRLVGGNPAKRPTPVVGASPVFGLTSSGREDHMWRRWLEASTSWRRDFVDVPTSLKLAARRRLTKTGPAPSSSTSESAFDAGRFLAPFALDRKDPDLRKAVPGPPELRCLASDLTPLLNVDDFVSLAVVACGLLVANPTIDSLESSDCSSSLGDWYGTP